MENDLNHIKKVIKMLHAEYRTKEFTDYHLEIKKRLAILYAHTDSLIKIIEGGEKEFLKNRRIFEGK